MPERVEGYEADETALRGGPGSVSWIDGLRKDARRALIRRLVMERIQLGGYDPRPNPHDGLSDSGVESSPSASNDRFIRAAEAIATGVAVLVVGAWVCSRLGIGARKGV
jgi:hypothetical protein